MKLPKYKPKRARIEIVPMIDTIFFLLVYFMIVTLTMTKLSAQRVSLPNSGTATAHPEQPVVVTVDKRGYCFIDMKAVSEDQIKPMLTARLRGNPNTTVVINCDKEQSVARFARVFDIVKQSNAASVMVATTPQDAWVAGQ